MMQKHTFSEKQHPKKHTFSENDFKFVTFLGKHNIIKKPRSTHALLGFSIVLAEA